MSEREGKEDEAGRKPQLPQAGAALGRRGRQGDIKMCHAGDA
jgi:hypothetical protein